MLDIKQPRVFWQRFLKKFLPAVKRFSTQVHIAKLQHPVIDDRRGWVVSFQSTDMDLVS